MLDIQHTVCDNIYAAEGNTKYIKNRITQTNRSNGGVIEGKNQRCQGTGGEGEARTNEKRQS